MSRFNVAVLLFLLALPAFSQESDTVHVIKNSDTLTVNHGSDTLLVSDPAEEEVLKTKSPTRALLYAMVLPGLGQAYNGKYYKIPIVWAALGVSGYAIAFNTRKYEEHTRNYILDESDANEFYMKSYRRNMELSYIVTGLIYGLQILDAYVDANLHSWDVNDNLSMGISPSLQPMMSHTSLSGYSGGLTCSFKIKGK